MGEMQTPGRRPLTADERVALKATLTKEKLFARVAKNDAGCWIWQGALSSTGYGMLGLKRHGRQLMMAAHRAAYELTHGAIPAGLMVCHRCDVPRCINPDHLFLGTATDNMQDALAKGRLTPASSPGEANPSAVLTQADVDRIRREYSGWNASQRFAKEFGVTVKTIRNIITARKWKGDGVKPRTMTTLADFKRRVQVGTRLECVSNTYNPKMVGPRTVVRAGIIAFWWTLDGDSKPCRTPYPKAADLTVLDDNTVEWKMFPDRDGVLRLRFVD